MSLVPPSLARALRLTVPTVLIGGLASCASRPAHAAPPAKAIHYSVAIPKPHTQYVEVEMRVPSATGKTTDVAMPAWIPGSYKIRDFARHVYDLEAVSAGGAELAVTRLDKQTWRISNGGRGFAVRYRVFSDERSVRDSHVDDQHASLNGATLFLYIPRERRRPCTVAIDAPESWEVYTALPPAPTAAEQSPTFSCTDYDHLVDSPLELSQAELRQFEVDGTRFEYVVTGSDPGVDVDRLADDARRFVTALGQAMGGFPMKRYAFLVGITPDGGGGLEHDESTMMLLRRDRLASGDGYLGAARLGAHEFFHLWNVRRIRDRALRPYDYAKENHTRLLWFHEGFTETAESLGMVRAGLVKPETFVRELGEGWTRYLRRPGRNYAPISEISFDAWTKLYQPAANHQNVAVSYYTKGNYIGLALDLELRLRSAEHGQQGDLFGVFRRLMQSHGQAEEGITLEDVIEATSAEAGEDMRWFFDQHVTGTKELPLPELLAKMGVKVEKKAPWDSEDATSLEARHQRVWSGLSLGGTTVRNVVRDSPADQAGFMFGDELVAVNDHRVLTEEQVTNRFAELGVGAKPQVHVFRDGRLLELSLDLAENPYRDYGFSLLPADDLDPEVRALRERWLAVWIED